MGLKSPLLIFLISASLQFKKNLTEGLSVCAEQNTVRGLHYELDTAVIFYRYKLECPSLSVSSTPALYLWARLEHTQVEPLWELNP
jgi:hypothetical protein